MSYHAAIQKIMGLASGSRSDSSPKLQFTKNGTFHISVFNDLHFAEDANNDVKTQDVMTKLIGMEDPQLIVVNGDLISGEATRSNNSDQFIQQVLKPLKQAEIPWASTYGNHDSDGNLDPQQDIYDHEKTYEKSLTRSMISSPTAGVTNYYLPVYTRGGSEDTPALLLWFFDSRGGNYPTNRGQDDPSGRRGDWVDAEVVKWFQEKNNNLTEEYGKIIPSLAFYHIPAHAMAKYQDDYYDNRTAPGINGESVVPQGGGATEYAGQDTRFMQALLETPGLMATFSGHDHLNDWCFKWNNGIKDQNLTGNGLNMCYGRRTGYGGYGDVPRGGRQILLREKHMEKEFDTWIRLEDGSISSAITLNSTYGQDRYTEREMSMLRVQASGSQALQSSTLLPLLMFWLFAFGVQYMRRL
ncbi:hypothetical protein PDE_05946 [Penicillium oxalicum 114-2]|uniref:Calcineurin-like phosphoesterase domain-containing protein n=2 Tax=Penicillium oxalicum TaxID=69781 RepID=S8B8C8_PENO1|nr:hypothetical protein PDE_05946 [Penicillium oxalicum 114-2]